MVHLESAKSINRNACYNIIKNISTIIFPLITFPYISRVLGAENIGKINFGSSVVNYFSLAASLGAGTYAVRECARIRESRKKLSQIASQIYSITIISAVMSYIALAVTLKTVSSLYSYWLLIAIQSLIILFNTLGTDWLNTAVSDFRFITVRTVLLQFLSLILMVLFVHKNSDYYKYVWISVIAASGANICNIIYRKKYCKIRFTFHLNAKTHLPPIFLMLSINVAQTIFVNMDTTILGLIRGDFETGLYGASVKIYNIVNMAIASVAWVVMPQMSELFAEKNYTKINGLLKYSLHFIILLGIPSIAGLNVLAAEIIEVLAGKEYLGAVTALHILTVSLAFSFAGGFTGNIILLPSKREKIMLAGSILSAVTNLILNLIFIPAYGINAAAAATAAANAIGFLISLPFIEKSIKIDGIWEISKGPFAGGLAIVISVSVIKYFTANIYVTVFLSLIISILIYVLILLVMKDSFAIEYYNQIKRKLTINKAK